MTYHDVGCDKLAAKTVDLTIDMAASAGTPDRGLSWFFGAAIPHPGVPALAVVAVNNGGREPASWSHPTDFGSQRETQILDEALARPERPRTGNLRP